eukprot:6463274-Amphidinium_carterae.2
MAHSRNGSCAGGIGWFPARLCSKSSHLPSRRGPPLIDLTAALSERQLLEMQRESNIVWGLWLQSEPREACQDYIASCIFTPQA